MDDFESSRSNSFDAEQKAMMKPVTTSEESSSQGKLDGQFVVNASTTTSSNTKTHKHWVQHIWREVLEIGFVILYLALSFAILETFKCATLLARCSENDFLAGYATAGIAALGLGKFVFVLEKMKISKRFEQRPLIVPVVYKSVLFTILVNVILHVEGRIMHHEIAPIPSLNDPVSYLLCFSAHQVGFLVTFFPFFCLREINRSLGEGRLYKLFFVSRDA